MNENRSLTISVSQGKKAEQHDKRIDGHYPKNADEELQKYNKTLVTTEDYDTAFREFFQDSVEEYNKTQKRADRRKKDYLDEIAHGNGKEHPYYEYVLQVGNHETNGTLDRSEVAMKAREALDAAASKLQERYPAFKFWFIGSHGDEPNGTYHYHICFTPVGTGYKNGMKTRCSLNKALENMGFKSKGKPYPIDLWKQDVEKLIEEEMLQRSLGRVYKNGKSKRKELNDFILEQMAQEAEENMKQTQEALETAQNMLAGVKEHREKIEEKLEEKKQKIQEEQEKLQKKQKTLDEQQKEFNKERDDFKANVKTYVSQEAQKLLEEQKVSNWKLSPHEEKMKNWLQATPVYNDPLHSNEWEKFVEYENEMDVKALQQAHNAVRNKNYDFDL